MTKEKYRKTYLPQIKNITKKLGLEYTDSDYDMVVNDAFTMVNAASSMSKNDAAKNSLTHKEIMRSSIISVYKKKHPVPRLSMLINIVGGAFLLYYYWGIVGQWCPMFSVNYFIAIVTCGIMIYRLAKNHLSFMDKIITRKMRVKRLKSIEL